MKAYIDARVVVSWMVEVVTDAGGQQYADVFARQLGPQDTLVHEAVHHLRHAEAVPEVVERVVAVVLLHAQLHATQAPSGESLCKLRLCILCIAGARTTQTSRHIYTTSWHVVRRHASL